MTKLGHGLRRKGIRRGSQDQPLNPNWKLQGRLRLGQGPVEKHTGVLGAILFGEHGITNVFV